MVVPESGSGSEGIKVHGDWIVEVTNPDGSLAKKIEFSNLITEDGLHVLATLMTHDIYMSDRRLWFGIGSTETGTWNTSGITCNGGKGFDGADVDAVAVKSANQQASIWGAGCIVSIENDSGVGWIRELRGKLTTSGEPKEETSEMSTFSKKVFDVLFPPIKVVDGQFIAAEVVYSFSPYSP